MVRWLTIDSPKELHDCSEKKNGLDANMQFDDETGEGYCGWCGEKVNWTKYFQEAYGFDHKEDVNRFQQRAKEKIQDFQEKNAEGDSSGN